MDQQSDHDWACDRGNNGEIPGRRAKYMVHTKDDQGPDIPPLTYGIEVWAKKGALKEAAKGLHSIIRKAFMIEKKTPILAIETELGIRPLDLYVRQRQDMFALRANHLNRQTRMSNSWLETSNRATIIDNSQGAMEVRVSARGEWKERINHKDIRYKEHPAK